MRASERAYTTLREEIVEGTLAPGTVLGEVEHSARLDLSRTPLREALARLVADGLVAPSPSRGLVVTEISRADARRLYDPRIALEVLAARRAAEEVGRADEAEEHSPGAFAALADRFEEAAAPLAAGADPTDYYALTAELDRALDAACANPYLVDSLRGLRLHLARLRRLARHAPRRLADSAREHAGIARAIASADPDLAAAATEVHLRRALAHLLAEQENTPPDPTIPPLQEETA